MTQFRRQWLFAPTVTDTRQRRSFALFAERRATASGPELPRLPSAIVPLFVPAWLLSKSNYCPRSFAFHRTGLESAFHRSVLYH